jgi:hypothetical protein
MIPVLIIPTMIHYNLLQNMLDSIDVNINELIIIDNGGKLQSIDCPQANKISIINFPRNLGVATSWNLGIKLTPYSKWWMFASDDIIFQPNKLQKIIDSNFESIIINKTGSRYFSAFAIHENVIDKIGLFNEYFYPGIGEETDYLERVYKNNIKIYNISNLYKDINGGGNTLKFYGFDEMGNNQKQIIMSRALEFDSKLKLNDWDLKYRRYRKYSLILKNFFCIYNINY